MRNTVLLALSALLLVGCVQTGKKTGDPHRTEYPPYDGPQLKVIVNKFTNKAEDANYSELGDVARDVLEAELGRSGAINLQDRNNIPDVLKEWNFSGGAGDEQANVDPGPVPNRPDVLMGGVVVNYGVRHQTVGFLVYEKKQIVECEVQIFIVDMHTMKKTTNYGSATFEQASVGGLGAGSATTYDRTLAKKALRAAIGDCWTRMMSSLRAVNPNKPAGE